MASRAVREENPVVADIMRALVSDGERKTQMEYRLELERRYVVNRDRIAELVRERPHPAPVSPLRQQIAAALVALAGRVAPAPRATDGVPGAEMLAVRHP